MLTQLLTAGVEAPSIGSYNTFGPKSRVSPSVSITSYCTVGAGCDLIPSPFSSTTSSARTSHGEIDMISSIPSVTISATDESTPPTPSNERLPEYTIVYGSESKRRLWSGEGAGQAKSLHVKHLEYLREILVRFALSIPKVTQTRSQPALDVGHRANPHIQCDSPNIIN
jgi:dynactin-6